MKKKRAPRGHMGFDLHGRPLAMDSPAVEGLVQRAINDPESEVVLVVLRYRGDLMMQVMNEPSRETLRDITQILETVIKGYGAILDGH